MHDTVGCALIGPGNFGSGLVRTLVEDGRVQFVGVLGATPEEGQRGAATLGGRAFATLDELINTDDVDAVLIATPTDTHAALAVQVAQAGKHVFCEKPMALTVAECDAMIAAARDAGVALMIGQVQRLFPLLADVRRLVHADAIGRPVHTLMYRHDLLQRTKGSWLQRQAQVGGLLHQSCVHELDWLRTTFGEVSDVFARPVPVTIQAGLDFPDAFDLSLRFDSGCIATLSACMTSYVERHGGMIHGARGTIAFDLLQGTLDWHDNAGQGESVQRDEFRRSTGHGIATRAELRAFVDAALGLAPPLISGEEGRANVAVIEAALRSAAEGQAVDVEGSYQWKSPTSA